jgi:nuclear transport factor 2 (NTF2) superfamily protein
MAARTRLPTGQGGLGLRENRIAVGFAYEWHDDSGDWFRSYRNENGECAEHGLMRLRIASINDWTVIDMPGVSHDRERMSAAAAPIVSAAMHASS